MRILFLLLLLLNVAFFAWQYRLQQSTNTITTSSGVAAEAGQQLQLLSERKSEPVPPRHTAPRAARAAVASVTCFRVGSFDTAAQATAFSRAPALRKFAHEVREEHEERLDNYWLKWAATLSIDDARIVLRRLQAKGVRDIAITPLGNHQYTISLGVFRQHATLIQRQQRLATLGYAPVVKKRYQIISRYWVHFVGRSPTAIRLGALLAKQAEKFSGLTVKKAACTRAAPANSSPVAFPERIK